MYKELTRELPAAHPESGFDPTVAYDWSVRRATDQAHRAANARKLSVRRRKVDPTTCERDYSAEELEFMAAMQSYKQRSGRMFPTWSEVLEVLNSLGYEKPAAACESANADRSRDD